MKWFDYMESMIMNNCSVSGQNSGLKAIIAIHDTTWSCLGRSAHVNYASRKKRHRRLRLARGMTYVQAAAGLNLGRKTVIIGIPEGQERGDVPRPRPLHSGIERALHHGGGRGT